MDAVRAKKEWDPSGDGSHLVRFKLRLPAYLAAAFRPACSAKVAALSVASQVNSGSDAAEVAVGSCLLVDRPAQVQALDNRLWA